MNNSRKLIRVVAANNAIALIPPLLVLIFNPGASFHRLLMTFAFSAVYANVIGTTSHIVIPKLWPVFWRYPKPFPWILLIALLLVIAIIGSLVATLIFIALGWISSGEYWLEFSLSVRLAIVITLSIGLVVSLYEGLRAQLEATNAALRTKELERERALKLATEAQLASLESRIHPHFLFNTLNSISSLIPEDPKAAERLVERMAALLRFSLDAKSAGLVPLENEMKIVTDYLEIEKARFGKRLDYAIDIPPDMNQARVPPLSIQTLVENSVKFSIGPNRIGGVIHIRGARENGCIQLEVCDSGPGFELESAPPGHGIDNLQDRLAALFGPQASLSVAKREHESAVILSIPQS